MKRQLWGVLLSLTGTFLTCAQAPVVKVKLRAVLVDSQLNQKPVPLFDPSTVQRVWTDFQAFRTATAAPTLAPPITDPATKAPDKH